MELLKQLLAMQQVTENVPTLEGQVTESVDVKSLILEAVKHTINVRGAEGADPFAEGDQVTWGVRYDFPEHGEDIEQELTTLLRPLGTVTFEMVNAEDEDEEEGFALMGGYAIYEAQVNLTTALSDDAAKDLEEAIQAIFDEDNR